MFFTQISSLEKVFLDTKPNFGELTNMSAFKNERVSYQIAYSNNCILKSDVKISLKSPLKELITLRTVGNVPSELPAYYDEGMYDENYISTSPGLFPDPLYPLTNDYIEVVSHTYHSLWVTVNLNGCVDKGKYIIEITFSTNEFSETKVMQLEIIDAYLPEQKLIYTQWLHADCIATYYDYKMFSYKHWCMIEKFIKTAVDNGINMILTPVFTPPLDTGIGNERPTVQLVKIEKRGESYTFDFSLLSNWINICKRNGIKYYEMAHLFSQWGATHTPKIEVLENGEQKKIFGWNVDALSPMYRNFLSQFIPALIKFLKDNGLENCTFFHISDEPQGEQHINSYSAAKCLAMKYLEGFPTIDALSDYKFYEQGIVNCPIPATDSIKPFLENNVPNLWAYYCCAQNVGVSNRFMSMPSYRNRIISQQLYKYNLKGFLHWGYNFYYSNLSRYPINPYLTTDAGNSFPSGDAFSVYPGRTGPIESLRLVVFNEALQDLRAFKLLESYVGHDAVVNLIENEANMKIEFDNYPQGAEYILATRDKLNREIMKFV